VIMKAVLKHYERRLLTLMNLFLETWRFCHGDFYQRREDSFKDMKISPWIFLSEI